MYMQFNLWEHNSRRLPQLVDKDGCNLIIFTHIGLKFCVGGWVPSPVHILITSKILVDNNLTSLLNLHWDKLTFKLKVLIHIVFNGMSAVQIHTVAFKSQQQQNMTQTHVWHTRYRTAHPSHPLTEITPNSALKKHISYIRSRLSALWDELVTFWSVWWPVFRALSVDRPYNLWLEHPDSHNQQQSAPLIRLEVTKCLGTDKHMLTFGNCESNSVQVRYWCWKSTDTHIERRWLMYGGHQFMENA